MYVYDCNTLCHRTTRCPYLLQSTEPSKFYWDDIFGVRTVVSRGVYQGRCMSSVSFLFSVSGTRTSTVLLL